MASSGGLGVGVVGGSGAGGTGGVGGGGASEGLRFRDLVTGETGAGGAKGAAEWTDVAVATFLECFAEKYAAVKHKNLRGKDWKEVVDNLNKKCVAEGGPYFEYKQCRNKLDGLKKRFRQEKESLNANLQPSKWQWYSRMCELRGRRNPRIGGGTTGLEKSGELDLTEGADNTSDNSKDPDGADGLAIGTPIDPPDRTGTPPFCSQNEVDTASPRSKPRANLGKKTRKRRRSHSIHNSVSEMMPGTTNQQVALWPGENERKPLATDRTYKLKIKRAGEEDFEDLFHLTGETVQDLIDSFKAVYWEEENTQVRVQLKDKSSDAWVTVAPSVSLSQYGMEAQIIIRPQAGHYRRVILHILAAQLLITPHALEVRKYKRRGAGQLNLFLQYNSGLEDVYREGTVLENHLVLELNSILLKSGAPASGIELALSMLQSP